MKETVQENLSAQSHLRKHEGLENNLVALEAKLQVLMNDSASLQAHCPGDNGNHISQQQNNVLQAWNKLQNKVDDIIAALMSCVDCHNFMGIVKDLLAWYSNLRKGVMTEEKASDAASAQIFQQAFARNFLANVCQN